MPRDFRPKGQSSSSRKRNDSHENPKLNVADDDPNVPDDVLREQVAAMGGTDEDLDLIQGKARGPATKLTDAERPLNLWPSWPRRICPPSRSQPR